jgi:hypothetical protein
MIYNYRIDRSDDAILKRIAERLNNAKEKELSQGWGGGDGGGLPITDDDFVSKCKAHYELATTRVPSNLTRIRDLKRGDLMVVPHLPAHGQVSLHVIADDFPDCYRYVPDDADHQNHRLRIEQSYGLAGEISTRHLSLVPWYGKLQWFRLPVLPIPQYESAFRAIVEQLTSTPNSQFSASNLSDFLESLRSGAVKWVSEQLRQTRPSGTIVSFEAICERLLLSAGYQVVRRNWHNNQGGDVDLHCVRDRSDASPFETGQTTLFVQVKKHIGTTDSEGVKQLLLMIEGEPTADGCVMSLGESFTEDAQELAEKNGVALMTGDIISQLVLEELAKHAGD